MHRDNRGVSELIGAVFIFAILIISFSLYQAYSVPAQNQRAEFEHNLDVQSDFQDLRDTILSVGATGTTQSTTVSLGMRYPSRIIAVNLPPVRGELRTLSNTSNLEINNASVVGSSNAAAYWENQTHSYNTTILAYDADYNEYRNAPDHAIRALRGLQLI